MSSNDGYGGFKESFSEKQTWLDQKSVTLEHPVQKKSTIATHLNIGFYAALIQRQGGAVTANI